MAKLTLNNIPSGFISNTAHNTNNDLIEAALENTLSRDGTGPNQMEANLDMNSNRIVNLPEPLNDNEAARLVDVQNAVAGGSANLISFTPAGAISANNVQAAIEEVGQFLGSNYADAGGTVDAITASYPNAPTTTLSDGYLFRVHLTGANATTTPTFQPTIAGVAQTARRIYKYNSAGAVVAVTAGDLTGEVSLVYDLPNLRYIALLSANIDGKSTIDFAAQQVTAKRLWVSNVDANYYSGILINGNFTMDNVGGISALEVNPTLIGTNTTLRGIRNASNYVPTQNIVNLEGLSNHMYFKGTTSPTNIVGVETAMTLDTTAQGGTVGAYYGFITAGIVAGAAATTDISAATQFYANDIALNPVAGVTISNVTGFKSAVSAGTSRYAFHGAGTAANLFLGDMQLSKTITPAGTTGAQTINKNSGCVNFAAGAATVVVTNSLVTTNSVIHATVGTNDATMKSASAVAASGSFTLRGNATPTAECRVNFLVTN